MGKRVIIDTEECTSCETCAELCPDVFEFNQADQVAFVIKAEGGPKDCIDDALHACPAECIHLE